MSYRNMLLNRVQSILLLFCEFFALSVAEVTDCGLILSQNPLASQNAIVPSRSRNRFAVSRVAGAERSSVSV